MSGGSDPSAGARAIDVAARAVSGQRFGNASRGLGAIPFLEDLLRLDFDALDAITPEPEALAFRRLVLDALSIEVRVFDSLGRVVLENQTARNNSLLDRPDDPLEEGQAVAMIAKAITSALPTLGEVLTVFPESGLPRMFLCSAIPLIDDCGRVLGALFTKRDLARWGPAW